MRNRPIIESSEEKCKKGNEGEYEKGLALSIKVKIFENILEAYEQKNS